MKNNSMWYNIDETLSYNCLFNFVVGPRGVGKTYAAKKRAIKNFLKDGSQFVYLRRFETEVKKSQLDNFFNDIYNEFPGVELEHRNKVFFVNDEPAGFAIPLSKAAQYKSVPFSGVTLIIFDEFIIDQGLVRYLPNEVQSFLEMYSTIGRLRDPTVMFLSNAITFTNPYFLYFKLEEPTSEKKIRRYSDMLIQYVDSPQYTREANNTRFGKIIAGTDYASYANSNEFLRDSDKFIEKMKDDCVCRCIIKANDLEFGVYSYHGEMLYISDKTDKTCKNIIATANSQHSEKTAYRDSEKYKGVWQYIQQMYYAGRVRFTSVKAKNVVAAYLINIWK